MVTLTVWLNRAVSEAIESARDLIFIEDWWLVGVEAFTQGAIIRPCLLYKIEANGTGPFSFT
jgi:hypothetical protein